MTNPDGEIIDSLASNDDVSTADKLLLFVSLCDEKLLIQQMKKTAMMAKVGLYVPTIVDTLAYGVLKISYPHLFKDEEETT